MIYRIKMVMNTRVDYFNEYDGNKMTDNNLNGMTIYICTNEQEKFKKGENAIDGEG